MYVSSEERDRQTDIFASPAVLSGQSCWQWPPQWPTTAIKRRELWKSTDCTHPNEIPIQQKDLGCSRSYTDPKPQNRVLFQSHWAGELLGSLERSVRLCWWLSWSFIRESGSWIIIYSSCWSAEIYNLTIQTKTEDAIREIGRVT